MTSAFYYFDPVSGGEVIRYDEEIDPFDIERRRPLPGRVLEEIRKGMPCTGPNGAAGVLRLLMRRA